MRQILKATAFLAMMLPGAAAAQCYSATPLPVNTVLGRLGVSAGPCQAIPFATLSSKLTGASITLNSGNGQTAPGSMAGGNTYTFGANTDTPRFAGIGLGGAAPATGLEIYNAAASPSGNGQGMLGGSSTNGGTLLGQGSVYDAVLANKSGTVALGLTTGTTGLVLTGTLTAASLSTAGSVAGSICATSAGLILYEAGVNCFTVSGVSVASGKTLTVSNTLTLTGTDGTSFAFPATSDSVATLGANQTVTGNKTFSGTLNITGTGQINGTAFGTFATQNFATPPAIGATTPAAGNFSTLTATTPLGLASGGTNASTPATARASGGLNIDQLTSHGDSNYSILATDRRVGTSAALTASRTWTLPAASSVNAGQELIVADYVGGVSNTNTLTVQRSGSDTVNGSTSITINVTNGAYLFISDGVSRFSAQALGAAATVGVAAVNGQTGNVSVVAGTGASVSTSGGNITVANTGLLATSTGLTNTSGTAALDPAYRPNLSFGGRLTLISGKPNIDVDVVSAQHVYYAPAENKGVTVPIYNGTDQRAYQFTSGPTDQVGLDLNLAGSANWAAGTVHDVFVTLNGGVPVLATRLWDAGMSPTTAQITNATLITTGTTPNTWTRASNAFDGTTVRATATSAVLVTSNTGQDTNCLGQDWGVGVTKIVSQVRATAPTDNYLFNTGPTSVQFTTYGSNDNANWQILDVRYLNVASVGIGGTATLPINQSYQTPYRYVRMCVRGDGVNNVIIAQLKFDAVTAAAGGRRLTKYNGVLTNDASMTARIDASTTITVPTNQGTYLGTIGIDAGGNGAVSAYINAGPSRVYNIWNIENQIDIVVRAVVNTLAATGVAGYTYNIASNQSWTTIQSATFNINVLVGYSRSPVTASLVRDVYFLASGGAVSGYSAGIAVDTVAGGFSGTECSGTVDTSGQNLGFQCIADLVIPPFFGTHLLTAIETLAASTGTMSAFTDLRNTRLQASWKG